MTFSPYKVGLFGKNKVFVTPFLPEITHFTYYSIFLQRNLYYLQKKSVKIKTFFKVNDHTDFLSFYQSCFFKDLSFTSS